MNEVQPTLWRAELASHLAGLLEDVDPAVRAELEVDAEWIRLGGGETLFRRGDPGDSAYIVISGRLRVIDDRRGERMLNEVGAGETLGEMALLSGEPRSATVYAVRDSLLAKIGAEAFNRLVERHPRVLRRIAGLLVERLRRYGLAAPNASAVKTIAIVPAGERADSAGFVRRLANALAAHGATRHLDAQRVDQALARDGIARCEDGDPDHLRLVRWLNEQECSQRFVLYETDSHPSAWSDRAVRQADHVLFVVDASGSPQPGELEQRLAVRWSGARAPRRSLVLVHPANAGTPHGTAAFLAPRNIDHHYHVRAESAEDFARLGRLLAGAGVGVVLGGGGARGFAHLGVLRALAEAGVPIDWVGGTSIGAIIAALAAQNLPLDASGALCRECFTSLKDPTFPFVALLAGRRIRAQLERAFGAIAIEDLPLPYLCVSTNLSRAAQTVHERGPLVRAIRASISLPGILPPVSIGADLHVDGALVNNLPIDVMAAKPEIGAVIAVDVSPEVEMRAPADLASELSGWHVLWQRLNPRGSRVEVPTIMNLLTRSALVASIHSARERHAAEAASLYLLVPVADLRLLAFEHVDEIARRGYESTRGAVRAWWESRNGA